MMEQLSYREIVSIGELEQMYETKKGSDTLQVPLPQHMLMQVFGNTQEFVWALSRRY
jgi:hypothetical protein